MENDRIIQSACLDSSIIKLDKPYNQELLEYRKMNPTECIKSCTTSENTGKKRNYTSYNTQYALAQNDYILVGVYAWLENIMHNNL